VAALRLFYRFMVRPFFREPVRTAVTILGIALGVAVVLAIDLAGDAATGSFRSSVETLSGDNNLEIRASGGLPESLVGTVAQLPCRIQNKLFH
jgi:putative ABC transport system permease protein